MIVAVNAGSSSLKFSVYTSAAMESPTATGIVGRIGQEGAVAAFEDDEGGRQERELPHADHGAAAGAAFDWIRRRLPPDTTPLVGHRVVHGGTRTRHALIDEAVEATIEAAAAFAPLHNPPALAAIRAARKTWGADASMVAVFDTAFFADLPEATARYAIPWELSERHGIRRYGFHGLAHESMTQKAAAVLRRPRDQLVVVTLQLGNGCSAALVQNGRAVDTSMGMTPLEGLMMGTRSGSLDPAIVPFIAEREGISAGEVIELLNSRSGLAGVSGVSSDMRDVVAAADSGDRRAEVAVSMFTHRVRKQIGAYVAAAGQQVHAIVFGGGIGEQAAQLRERILKGLTHIGIELDEARNRTNGADHDGEISTPASSIRVFVAHVDEMRVIARAAVNALAAESRW